MKSLYIRIDLFNRKSSIRYFNKVSMTLTVKAYTLFLRLNLAYFLKLKTLIDFIYQILSLKLFYIRVHLYKL